MNPNGRVLLTGASGFLGRLIHHKLVGAGFQVFTLGRTSSNIACDLSTAVPEIQQPIDFVVHNAGKAHSVPKNEKEAQEFYKVNVEGTSNLLKGLTVAPRAIVFISSISVYGLSEGEGITENAPLRAADPYGKSKIEAEKILLNYSAEKNIRCVILRLPLVAGQSPPGNLGAMIEGLRRRRYYQIGESRARKSVVMGEDVAALIPNIFDREGVYNLTDRHHPSFNDLERVITTQLGCAMPANLSKPIARTLGLAGDIIETILPGKAPITSKRIEKITSTLTFNDDRAVRQLQWKPQRVIDAFRI